jgi:hypothetical protein
MLINSSTWPHKLLMIVNSESIDPFEMPMVLILSKR